MNTKENLARGILVDEIDAHLLETHLFSISSGYAMTRVGDTIQYLHKMILPADTDVDHVNRNSLDNRRDNLRVATRSQNNYNTGKHSQNTSGYKGVRRMGNNWQARIKVAKVDIHIGTYLSKEQAALMYDFAAVKYHGKFARLNFDLELT